MADSNKRVPRSFDRDAGLFNQILHQAKLSWRLVLDPRVSPWLKLLPVGAVVYFFMPDLLPGPFDDAAVAWMAVRMFIELSPPEVVQEHIDEIYRVIPGKWKVSGDPDYSPADPPPSPPTVVDGEFKDAEDKPQS